MQATHDSSALVAILAASGPERSNLALLAAQRQHHDWLAAHSAVQFSVRHFGGNAALYVDSSTHACYLDAQLLEALGLAANPQQLVVTKNDRRHLALRVDRPNPDHINHALQHILYIGRRHTSQTERELIGRYMGSRYLLVAIEAHPIEDLPPKQAWHMRSAWWLNDKKVKSMLRRGVIRPVLRNAA